MTRKKGHSFKGNKKHEQKHKVTEKIGRGTTMIVLRDLIFGKMLC